MFYKELKRMFFNIPAFFIICIGLAVTLLLTYVTIHRSSIENGNVDAYYQEYMAKLEGELTEEKENFIQKEKSLIDDTIDKEAEMLTEYNDNHIDSDTYQKYLDDLMYAETHSASMEKINEQYQLVLRLKDKGISAHLFYDTYWNFYFDIRIVTFIQMMIVIAFVISYLSGDYVSGMWKMTQTYFNGRTRLFHIRLGVTLLYCIGTSFLYSIAYYVFFKTSFFMPDMGAPIQSLSKFENFPFHISIATFLVVVSIFRMMAFCLLTVLAFAVMSITKNITVSFGICTGVIIIPLIFSTSSDLFCNLSLYELLLGVGIMSRSESVSTIIIIVVSFTIFILFIYGIALYQQSDWRRIINTKYL